MKIMIRSFISAAILMLISCSAIAEEIMQNKILIILTSHAELPETKEKTGFWFEEMSTPYYEFKDRGYEVDIASIKGGKVEADPESMNKEIQSVQRFLGDQNAAIKIEKSIPITEVNVENYQAVFLSGGHGTMWDFYPNPDLEKILQHFIEENKVIAAVCHGPAGLLNLKNEDGTPFVENKKMTAFTNKEEVLAKKATVVPYMLETELKDRRANFKGTMIPFKKNVVQDGNLITGQNPNSSEGVALAVINALNTKNESF